MPFPKGFPRGDLPWLNITPQTLYWTVRHAAEVFGVKTFYITENGAAFPDEVTPGGEILDLDRREYLRNYLIELHRAIAEGYDVRGYFLWSILDNFEWAEGYGKRFGIVHVDYATQRRTPKLSATWYAEVVRRIGSCNGPLSIGPVSSWSLSSAWPPSRAQALLFAVEPMAAKALLPLLGGTAAVWSTCLAFFQAALLLGYFYAHATSRLSPRLQAILHRALLVACVLLQPAIVVSAADHPPPSADPTVWLLGRLAATLGLPFLALAATSTLLQRWFAASRPRADPYPLYAASNLGSLLALLAYPLLLEPAFPLATQARLWRYAFAAFVAGMAACAGVTIHRARTIEVEPSPGMTATSRDRALWVALAFVPSSLLQGVTTYLTTDIAPIPLLWVVPLALYLLSFVLTFASRPLVPHGLMVRALPITALILLVPLAAGLVQWFWMPVHLLFFFVAAMACHGELARRRPPPGELTGFYLAIALGGRARKPVQRDRRADRLRSDGRVSGRDRAGVSRAGPRRGASRANPRVSCWPA